jgi:hypothetical protein
MTFTQKFLGNVMTSKLIEWQSDYILATPKILSLTAPVLDFILKLNSLIIKYNALNVIFKRVEI